MTVIYMQSRPEGFGFCYECQDGFHYRCVGGPCQCECPEMCVQEAYERLMDVRQREAVVATQRGELAAMFAAVGNDGVHPGVEIKMRAQEAARAALNTMAIDVLVAEIRRLHRLINSPEIHDFAKAIVLEAAHQRERWPNGHDENKGPEDWFWLIGYLAGKAIRPDQPEDKRLHRIITIAAAAANWHAQAKARSEAGS